MPPRIVGGTLLFSFNTFGSMLLIPAIDLMDGCVVRLKQGRAEERTIYSDDPAAFARKWRDAGARWLHVVDLDGAFAGEPRNLDAVRAIVAALDIPVQLGGGLRSSATIRAALEVGVRRVILGTRAAENPEWIQSIVEETGPGRIVAGIDARDGIVATKGWTESSNIPAIDLARTVTAAGVRTIIYTDIATDGMLEGPNIAQLQGLAAAIDCEVIASGGVTTLDDVMRLAAVPGICAAIVGKALFEGRLDLAKAIAATTRPDPHGT